MQRRLFYIFFKLFQLNNKLNDNFPWCRNINVFLIQMCSKELVLWHCLHRCHYSCLGVAKYSLKFDTGFGIGNIAVKEFGQNRKLPQNFILDETMQIILLHIIEITE
jgi:hypothetical protein